MEEPIRAGENFDLVYELFRGTDLMLDERLRGFYEIFEAERKSERVFYHRIIGSPAGREVMVEDRASGGLRPMLMFGSNNYLGLGNHPYIREKVKEAIDTWGTGIGGPPFLNGYLKITQGLEERLAASKKKEAALIFSSGYSANLAVVAGLTRGVDKVLYDEYSHASFTDGMRMARVPAKRFPHNDLVRLERFLSTARKDGTKDVFVGVEGVYSMDGDLAPLDKIVPLCKRHKAFLIVDDAHGTGVMGDHGGGTGEHFDVAADIDVLMATFSKAIGVNGGFLAASRALIEYLRFAARSYMFSAAMPPTTIAAIHAALDVIEREPQLLSLLRANVRYLSDQLNRLSWGFNVDTPSAIIVLEIPQNMDIRRAAADFQDRGIFINPVEFPAVPLSKQRFRISVMATHTKADLDRLVEAVDQVWSLQAPKHPHAPATATMPAATGR